MEREEIEILGRYNAEVARGLSHTRKWKTKMKHLQKRYDDWYEKKNEKAYRLWKIAK